MRLRVLMIVAALVLAGAAVADALQEKPARATRSWRAYELPRGKAGAGADVDVVDTEGVCLYVVRGEQGEYGVTPVAIAAVSKTQLPAGAGCQ